MESSYVADVNDYLKNKGFNPVECRFDFLPLDLDWSGVSPTFDNLSYKIATQPLNAEEQKKYDALPDSVKKRTKNKRKKKKKDDKRGEFFRYVKSIRKENESWKEAIARAKQTRNPKEVEAQDKGGLWSRLSKNLSLTRDA